MLVTGTFNVLHPGHIRLLEFASRYGKVTVGINTDPFLVKKYGEKTIPLIDRCFALQACKYVDRVVAFREDTPSMLILKMEPTYYIKGPDYATKQLPETPAVRQVGAKLIIHKKEKEYNSTDLVEVLDNDLFKKIN